MPPADPSAKYWRVISVSADGIGIAEIVHAEIRAGTNTVNGGIRQQCQTRLDQGTASDTSTRSVKPYVTAPDTG